MKNLKKKAIRLLSIILILSILLGNILTVSAATVPFFLRLNTNETFFSNDPLRYMIDNLAENLCRYDEELENYLDYYGFEFEYQEFTDETSYELDDGRTNRFIVRYITGRRQSFQNTLLAQIASSEAMSVFVDMAVSFDVNRAISADNRVDFNDESRNGIEVVSITGDWEVLTLNERMLPSEFAEIIRNSSHAPHTVMIVAGGD